MLNDSSAPKLSVVVVVAAATHWIVVTLQDDARGVARGGTALVSVQIGDADGSALGHLRHGLDVSKVVNLTVDQTTCSQRTS